MSATLQFFRFSFFQMLCCVAMLCWWSDKVKAQKTLRVRVRKSHVFDFVAIYTEVWVSP